MSKEDSIPVIEIRGEGKPMSSAQIRHLDEQANGGPLQIKVRFVIIIFGSSSRLVTNLLVLILLKMMFPFSFILDISKYPNWTENFFLKMNKNMKYRWSVAGSRKCASVRRRRTTG